MSDTELPDMLIDSATTMSISAHTQAIASAMGVPLSALKDKIILLAIVDEINISGATPGSTVTFAPLPTGKHKHYKNVPAKNKVVGADEQACAHCRKVRPKSDFDVIPREKLRGREEGAVWGSCRACLGKEVKS